MASVTSKTTACVCAFCAAEMAGELIRNLSEKLPVEGACPCLWCRASSGTITRRSSAVASGPQAPAAPPKTFASALAMVATESRCFQNLLVSNSLGSCASRINDDMPTISTSRRTSRSPMMLMARCRVETLNSSPYAAELATASTRAVSRGLFSISATTDRTEALEPS